MASTFRAPGAPLPYIHGVDPTGSIRQLPYARNINAGMVEMVNGRLRLTRKMEDEGWVSLEDAYKSDPSAKKRAKGLEVYKDWERAAKQKRAPRFQAKKGDGSVRPATQPFPEHLLPEEVIARRMGTSSVSEQIWEAPVLDDDVTEPIEVSAIEPAPAPEPPKAKRGKSKA